LKLLPRIIPEWPKLAWVAQLGHGAKNIAVLHGSAVETSSDWCAEAVWAGPFSDGGFDQTDLVFGTGIRCRQDRVVFVASGTMMDRLWHCHLNEQVYVSNSMPALLACADLSLLNDYSQYPDDIATMRLGPAKCNRSIPTDRCDLHVTYFHNLVWNRSSVEEIAKQDCSPDFAQYADYFEFIVNVARRLNENYSDRSRTHRIVPQSSVSRGYDSCAAAAIAREAGCTLAVTIENASSLLPRSDSGREVAEHLGIGCRSFRHTTAAYRLEETVWAAAGQPAGLNLTVIDYPEPLCLFFTGYHGDILWWRRVLDRSEPCAVPTVAGLSLSEFRLHQGIFHCVVPFWGGRKAQQIEQVTFAREMDPWTLGGDYDRPIPRRILEESGVPRKSFGMRKEVTSAPGSLHWPFSAGAANSFRRYLRQRGVRAPGRPAVWLLRRLRHLDQLVIVNLNHLLGTRWRGFRKYLGDPGQNMIFQWANHRLKEQYQQGLRQVEKAGASVAE
jgi:hypothetical protein